MSFNPIKGLKNLILRFNRYFYDENLKYVDDLIEKQVKSIVPLIFDILLNGFVFWLVLLSLSSILPINWISLGPGAWHLLNIIQLGLILWFFEELYKFIRGGYKK